MNRGNPYKTILNGNFLRTVAFSLRLSIIAILLFPINSSFSQPWPRQDISLDNNWRSVADDSSQAAYNGFEQTNFNDNNWSPVTVPHNWDAYEGYRRMRHGNRHGYAWYRKSFTFNQSANGKRFFLYFEGVGSFATVWLNGQQVGTHAGGRTTFTLDITGVLYTNGKENLLAVMADHPANIKTLPWVCGGCSDERGFSEGSQPMGIFRPVHLVVTDEVRITPFGVHAWNDTAVTTRKAAIAVETELVNYGKQANRLVLINQLLTVSGTVTSKASSEKLLAPGEATTIRQQLGNIINPRLWSTDDPYLYQLKTTVLLNGKIIDQLTTPYGIRTISWPVGKIASSNQFLLNGKPVFINGIAEYEHQVGNSHAFSEAQIKARAMQVKASGFNAFRDAHQPHNLRYQHYWDSLGILWWTQQSAHVWYDTPEFRKNFKTLLIEWVKERRNSPSVVMWGLQNESKLPEDFARECTELIRQLDPTASSQRLVSTCNGGSGTDWDVPQNWTGTYGGNPATYDADLKKQILVGEYGAWRTLDLHTEGAFNQDGVYSEDRMTQLMETKVKLAEAAKDSVAGHFMWLLTSHDNPGRVQGGEGYRELDRIGPVNYKGLLTPWEEPLDAFYMYRANYVSNKKAPMVYIVSHTWPDRWTKPGTKDGIVVYSNCDEVELFNDIGSHSLGKRKRSGIGTHFQWDQVNILYNVLYAVGYVDGKAVAKDKIVLHHLPAAPHFDALYTTTTNITAAAKGYHYIYRVNCGGPAYQDKSGNNWSADRAMPLVADGSNSNNTWGSLSWTNDFKGMPSFFVSQRSTADPISGTRDWKLFQSFRYGRNKLVYTFPVPDGDYLVELYFIEPWWGTGGGMDCSGWRLFDVAINDQTVLKKLDIWKEAGHDVVLKKTVKVHIKGGRLNISFPAVDAGQAVISAIAIASLRPGVQAANAPVALIRNLTVNDRSTAGAWQLNEWLNTGDQQFTNDQVAFSELPPDVYGATWLATPSNINSIDTTLATFTVSAAADVLIAVDQQISQLPIWLAGFVDTKTVLVNSNGTIFSLCKKRFAKDALVTLGKIVNPSNAIASAYSVMALPATNIEPAYDLKPVITLKAVTANLFGNGISKGKIDGKDRVIFSDAAGENSVEWTFNIGAADIYSFTISYNNPNVETKKGKLQFLSADGKLLKEEQVVFTNTKPGKSNYINTNSGSMINAGNYTMRLTASDAAGLNINALDVQ